MKRTILATLTLLMVLSTACSKEKEIHDYSHTLGLLFFEPSNEWRQVAVNYGVSKATQLGYTYDLKLSANASQQEEALDELVEKGIKTIVICDQGLSAESVNRAIAKGVNIVLFDGEINCNYACYVSQSQEDIGKLAGEYLKTKSAEKIVVFNVTKGQSISIARADAFKKAIGTQKEIVTIDIENFSPEAVTATVLSQIVAANPDGIWFQDDQQLMMMIETLVEKAPNLKYMVGSGAYQPFLQIIKNNSTPFELATITFSPQVIEEAVSVAGNLINNIQPSEKRIIKPGSLITKENVEQFIKGGGVKF